MNDANKRNRILFEKLNLPDKLKINHKEKNKNIIFNSASKYEKQSPFPEKYREASARIAQIRNFLVAALADRVLVFHAAPGGKTEELVKAVLGWGKTVYTIESEYNAHLAKPGVRMIHSFKDLE